MKHPFPAMIIRSVEVEICHIGYLRWCLESHDGIANPTTRIKTPNIIDLSIAPDFIDDADALIDALENEIGLTRVAPPLENPLLTDG